MHLSISRQEVDGFMSSGKKIYISKYREHCNRLATHVGGKADALTHMWQIEEEIGKYEWLKWFSEYIICMKFHIQEAEWNIWTVNKDKPYIITARKKKQLKARKKEINHEAKAIKS